MSIITKKVIMGCESDGTGDSPFLSRYSLKFFGKEFTVFGWKPMVHVFHRSDNSDHHDHPFNFVSIILWRGYWEETVCPRETRVFHTTHADYAHMVDGGRKIPWAASKFLDSHPHDNGIKPIPGEWGAYETYGSAAVRKRIYPGMVLFRPATWRHRVVLVDNKPAVTLVIRSPYVREWGFFTSKGWQIWKDYFAEKGC